MKYLDTHTDEHLLQLLKSGDRKAFESIYRKYWALLLDTAYKRVKSREVAEEIIQDLFTSLWCRREEIQVTHSFSGYIHTALKYRIFNFIRKEMINNKYVDHIKKSQPEISNPVEESLLYNELNLAFEKEINNLPKRCKQVFYLSRKEHLSLKEIAVELNISTNTVEKHMGKALKIIRDNLKDYVAGLTFLLLLF